MRRTFAAAVRWARGPSCAFAERRLGATKWPDKLQNKIEHFVRRRQQRHRPRRIGRGVRAPTGARTTVLGGVVEPSWDEVRQASRGKAARRCAAGRPQANGSTRSSRCSRNTVDTFVGLDVLVKTNAGHFTATKRTRGHTRDCYWNDALAIKIERRRSLARARRSAA